MEGSVRTFFRWGSEARAEVKELFEILQVNPYDPNVQQKVYLHDETFEYPLDGGYSIFWKVYHKVNHFSIVKMRVLVLAIEKRQRR